MINSNFPILDSHAHLDFRGRNIEAVKEFEKSGGTHLILAHKPYSNITSTDHHEQFETTLKLARLTREKTNIKVFSILAPHPTEFTHFLESKSLEESKDIMLKGIDLAGKFIEQGEAIAFGEVGRPHYEVSEEVWRISNEILKYSMNLAKDLGCAVVLHTESKSSTFRELADIAESIGLNKENVVKHFSPPIVDINENFGLFPSIIATEKNIKKAITQGNRFMLETDYIDDLKRPGAVLGLKSVPKKTYSFFEKGIFTEEDIWKIHKENPEKVFGVDI